MSDEELDADWIRYRSAVFSQLKVKHGWHGIISDLCVPIELVEEIIAHQWEHNHCPFCAGDHIAWLCGFHEDAHQVEADSESEVH